MVAHPRHQGTQCPLRRILETEELGIAAGLQDRVVQTYEGLVYMDFAKQREREIWLAEAELHEPSGEAP